MLVLAINTSTKIGTVALYHSETGLVSEITLNIKLNHSNTLMTSIDNVFKFSGYTIKDVEKIAVSIGPGSFTGIRIGVGVAKGLAYSLNVPIVGINELDIIAYLGKTSNKKVISVIDARKERVYYSIYKESKDTMEKLIDYKDGELSLIAEEFKNEELLFVGDASIIYKERIIELFEDKAFFNTKSLSIPRASILGEVSLSKEADDLVHLEPYYHSKTQAERMKEASKNKK